MDQEEAPADILKQWQEARANRRMQFKVGNYRDGDWVSNIRMLTGTIKADWIQLPVERYLAALPTLRHGVIAGVFRNKGAAPWGITRAEKLQLSVFLPNRTKPLLACIMSRFLVCFPSYWLLRWMRGLGSSARATQPFLGVNTTTRCLSLSRSVG